MPQRTWARLSGMIMPTLITAVVAISYQPMRLLAQSRLQVSEQTLPQRNAIPVEAENSPTVHKEVAFEEIDFAYVENCENAETDCETNTTAEEEATEPAFLIPLFLGPCGSITFKPGLRLQPRYEYHDENHENDFFIRRFRFKAAGDAFELAKYYAELKIDNTGRFERSPKAEVENAWLDFRMCQELFFVRVGLYDVPFSRNALTSDSKLLLMDRSLIKKALTALGFADNTIGLLVHGRPWKGRLEYAVGIFDNIRFEKIGTSGPRSSKQLMPAGRLVLNLLDPATPPDGYADYRGSYICQGQRLAIGVNSAYLGDARDRRDKFDIYAWGTDLFFNRGPFTFQAEYDLFKEKIKKGRGSDIKGYGWYAQAGYLFYRATELAFRYQELEPDRKRSHNKSRWTTVGLNIYIREHNLKIQTDYTFKRDQGEDGVHGEVFRIQWQIDY